MKEEEAIEGQPWTQGSLIYRDEVAPFILDGACEQHELVARRRRADLEPVLGVFRQHARREGAKILAVLHLLIEDVAHVRPARIGEQRTVAERPRPELHAALKPGDDLAVGDHVGSVARR